MNVYTLVESVHHEGDWIRGVYGDELAALDALDERIEGHRYGGEWERWTNEGKHVESAKNRDVTFVVRRWEVEE